MSADGGTAVVVDDSVPTNYLVDDGVGCWWWMHDGWAVRGNVDDWVHRAVQAHPQHVAILTGWGHADVDVIEACLRFDILVV